MHPYKTLESKAFWSPAVAVRNPLEVGAIWRPRANLSSRDPVITSGSCFAQHISRSLAQRGFNWIDAEPGPGEPELDRRFGYGVFSFRSGNIYTAALLKQWIEWAFGITDPSNEVWHEGGRFIDPFRPKIEPGGFASVRELQRAREATLIAVRKAIKAARVFVFTMGLTEAWVNKKTGVVYPMCPGTAGGTFDSNEHIFKNFRHGEIYEALATVMSLARELNPSIRFLFTVSPVPLTATASGEHVLVATTYSKSTLRAVAGDLRSDFPFVDYFPSYELITGIPFRSMFFMPNLREVSQAGVDFVMSHFFGAARQRKEVFAPNDVATANDLGSNDGDVQCEEVVLEAFAR